MSPKQNPFLNPGKASRANLGHFMASLINDTHLWNKWKEQMLVIYKISSWFSLDEANGFGIYHIPGDEARHSPQQIPVKPAWRHRQIGRFKYFGHTNGVLAAI